MDDRAKAKKMFGPGLAIGALVVLLAAFFIIGGGSRDITRLADGSNPTDKDSKLKAMGDGLEYRDLKVGDGPELSAATKTVKVHYTGWLPDGTLFESTRKGGVPATLPYTDVIDGWKRGMIGMKPGGIRKLVIPPALAYGSQGKGSIPANSPLIFEIELVESVKNEPRAGDIPTLTDGTSPGDVDTGLKDMADGLKYRDLKVGDGPEITPQTQDVTVHYVGWLTDGLMFDSSRPRNEPLTIGLNNVIQGWKRGMIGMKAGGIRKLVIPAPLGYGSRGSGEIPPDATLVFEVELLSSK